MEDAIPGEIKNVSSGGMEYLRNHEIILRAEALQLIYNDKVFQRNSNELADVFNIQAELDAECNESGLKEKLVRFSGPGTVQVGYDYDLETREFGGGPIPFSEEQIQMGLVGQYAGITLWVEKVYDTVCTCPSSEEIRETEAILGGTRVDDPEECCCFEGLEELGLKVHLTHRAFTRIVTGALFQSGLFLNADVGVSNVSFLDDEMYEKAVGAICELEQLRLENPESSLGIDIILEVHSNHEMILAEKIIRISNQIELMYVILTQDQREKYTDSLLEMLKSIVQEGRMYSVECGQYTQYKSQRDSDQIVSQHILHSDELRRQVRGAIDTVIIANSMRPTTMYGNDNWNPDDEDDDQMRVYLAMSGDDSILYIPGTKIERLE